MGQRRGRDANRRSPAGCGLRASGRRCGAASAGVTGNGGRSISPGAASPVGDARGGDVSLVDLCETCSEVTRLQVSIVLTAGGEGSVVVGATDGAGGVEDLQLTLGEGPGVDALALGRPVLVDDLSGAGTCWVHFVPAAWALGVAPPTRTRWGSARFVQACSGCTPSAWRRRSRAAGRVWRPWPSWSPTPFWGCSRVRRLVSCPGRWRWRPSNPVWSIRRRGWFPCSSGARFRMHTRGCGGGRSWKASASPFWPAGSWIERCSSPMSDSGGPVSRCPDPRGTVVLAESEKL